MKQPGAVTTTRLESNYPRLIILHFARRVTLRDAAMVKLLINQRGPFITRTQKRRDAPCPGRFIYLRNYIGGHTHTSCGCTRTPNTIVLQKRKTDNKELPPSPKVLAELIGGRYDCDQTRCRWFKYRDLFRCAVMTVFLIFSAVESAAPPAAAEPRKSDLGGPAEHHR